MLVERTNKEVIIKTENEDIIFENSGNELKYPLENYFEAFFSKEEKQKNSLGLGLYIIYNIHQHKEMINLIKKLI